MPEFPISPEAVEAHTQAMREAFRAGMRYGDLSALAIRAADKARGLREERRGPVGGGEMGELRPREQRLVTDWRSVDSEPRVAFDGVST